MSRHIQRDQMVPQVGLIRSPAYRPIGDPGFQDPWLNRGKGAGGDCEGPEEVKTAPGEWFTVFRL